MMNVTATELKSNLGKYLAIAGEEDVLISKNGRAVAKLTAPHRASRADEMRSLFGILPSDVTLEDAREAREEQSWGL